jgi:hypothetical protein
MNILKSIAFDKARWQNAMSYFEKMPIVPKGYFCGGCIIHKYILLCGAIIQMVRLTFGIGFSAMILKPKA